MTCTCSLSVAPLVSREARESSTCQVAAAPTAAEILSTTLTHSRSGQRMTKSHALAAGWHCEADRDSRSKEGWGQQKCALHARAGCPLHSCHSRGTLVKTPLLFFFVEVTGTILHGRGDHGLEMLVNSGMWKLMFRLHRVLPLKVKLLTDTQACSTCSFHRLRPSHHLPHLSLSVSYGQPRRSFLCELGTSSNAHGCIRRCPRNGGTLIP